MSDNMNLYVSLNAAALTLQAARAVGDEQEVDAAEEILREVEERALAEQPWRPCVDLAHVERAIRLAQLGGNWAHARSLAERTHELSQMRQCHPEGENPLDTALRLHAQALKDACSWEAQLAWQTGCTSASIARYDHEHPAGFPATAGIVARYEGDSAVEYLCARVDEPRHGVAEDWLILFVTQTEV